ncbi:Ras GTPase-activating protein 3, partial [Frankliniella fusca]
SDSSAIVSVSPNLATLADGRALVVTVRNDADRPLTLRRRGAHIGSLRVSALLPAYVGATMAQDAGAAAGVVLPAPLQALQDACSADLSEDEVVQVRQLLLEFQDRVASVMIGDEGSGGMPDAKKLCGTHSNEGEQVDQQHAECKVDSENGNGDVVSKDNGEANDDLFEDLNEPVNRVIQKVSEMKVGVIYELVDIYSINVDNRLAIVGGFQLEDEDIMYVWLPVSLVRNYDARKVIELKSKIVNGNC